MHCAPIQRSEPQAQAWLVWSAFDTIDLSEMGQLCHWDIENTLHYARCEKKQPIALVVSADMIRLILHGVLLIPRNSAQ